MPYYPPASSGVADGSITTAKLGGDVTTAGKALLDDADNAAQRSTLGLGTAATAASADFATATHTHAQSDVTNLVTDLAGKASSSHTHAQSDITNLVTDLAGKASSTHAHAASDITSGLIATARLGSGTANSTTFLRGDQTYATPSGGASDLVYVASGADTAINSVTDVTIVTRDVTSVGTTDKLIVEADFVILNNSTAARTYVITLDFDALFDIEFTTGSLAFSSTLMHPFTMRAVLDIRSSSLAYCTSVIEGRLAAGIASGTDTTMAATHLRAHGWGTTASNASGTTTVALFIRSANATATQTCRLHALTIRQVTPT